MACRWGPTSLKQARGSLSLPRCVGTISGSLLVKYPRGPGFRNKQVLGCRTVSRVPRWRMPRRDSLVRTPHETWRAWYDRILRYSCMKVAIDCGNGLVGASVSLGSIVLPKLALKGWSYHEAVVRALMGNEAVDNFNYILQRFPFRNGPPRTGPELSNFLRHIRYVPATMVAIAGLMPDWIGSVEKELMVEPSALVSILPLGKTFLGKHVSWLNPLLHVLLGSLIGLEAGAFACRAIGFFS